jgi:acrylyl-CoA reductase (NADPH)
VVDVEYSAVNYKDALALSGQPGVVRTTPLVPGIDAAGVVAKSSSEAFPRGTRVVLTGYGYGETRHGGLATAVVASDAHLTALPDALTTQQAATIGTAGVTALLALRALKSHGLSPESSNLPLAVTGAAGAVGSFAVFFANQQGFSVTAITGRTHEEEYLRALGASAVVARQEILSLPNRPLQSETFAGAIDQAGGPLLAKLLGSTHSMGVVAACGLAGSSDLPTTVMPFILRGVTLVGINSVYPSQEVRTSLWEECAQYADLLPWNDITELVELGDAKDQATRVLSGVSRGRVVVSVADGDWN